MKERRTIAVLLLVLLYGFICNANKQLKYHHLNVESGLPQNSVYSIAMDKFGFMWFGTWGGAVRYDGYSYTVYQPHENDSTSLPSYRIRCIVKDSVGNIWIETEDLAYLYKYDYEKDNFASYSRNEVNKTLQNKIANWHSYSFKEAQNSLFSFLTTDDGLLQIDRSTGEHYRYRAETANPFSISDNSVKNVFLDEQETLWFGTQNGGVNFSSMYSNSFQNVFTYKNNGGLISNGVRAICVDHTGNIYVGSENRGLTIINTASKPYTYSYLSDDNLINLHIRALHCDNDGVIWIGTKDGLFTYNPVTRRIRQYLKDSFNLQVFSLFTDHNNQLWVGTMQGLARFDAQTERLIYLADEQKPMGRHIRSIFEDKEYNLWIATEDQGITCLSRKIVKDSITFIPKNYQKIENKENSILSNRTYSLTIDGEGYVWVATSFGLSRLNPASNTFKNFTVNDKLPDNRIMSVVYDGRNSVWFSHNKGLSRINTSSYEMQHFDVQDGLQGNEFIQSASYYDESRGLCYFGGNNGLSYFQPEKVSVNPYPPMIALTDLFVSYQRVIPCANINNQVILEKSLLCTDEIKLSWQNKNFRIEFAALHYANPSGNSYKYKLEGFDEEWVSTDASLRSASYSNLDAGNYTFKVLASNSHGVWAPEPKTLKIQILPPWWLSTWMILAYVMLILFFILFVYRMIVVRISAKHAESLHLAKAHFFTEISHEFRTPLTLILDPLNKLISGKTDDETTRKYYRFMQRNAQQLLHLINQLLDFRKLESGQMRLSVKQHDLILFMKQILTAFEDQANSKHIDLCFKSNLASLQMLFDEQKLNMVMNNLLSNAIKFTAENGKICVEIILDNENKEVKVAIRDNGVGIARDEQKTIFDPFYQSANNMSLHKGTGIGLALTKELILLHKGNISVNSQPGQGSTFTFLLPVITNEEHREADRFYEENYITLSDPDKDDITPDETTDQPLLLVVDDNEDIREYIRLNFAKQFRLIMAKDGFEGLEMATVHIPDIIISDVMMPQMDGIALCEKLKMDQRTCHIPIILLTARQSDDVKTEGYKTGADAYLTKPFSSEMLLVRLQNLLEQRRKLRELFSSNPANKWKTIVGIPAEQAFLDQVQKYIHEHLDNPDFSIDQLSEHLGMSRSQFYRKIKALTNKSGNEFITSFRMSKGVELMLEEGLSVSETAYKVGYSAPNSFTRAFLKHFGMSPSQYIEKNK